MKIHIYRVALIIVLLFIHLISSAPLQQNVLKYLEKDKETFQEYRNHYKFLSCKLMTYSKMKYLYEKEIIDPFVKQTTKKDDFIDALREKILDFCTSVYNGSNMVNICIFNNFRKFLRPNCMLAGKPIMINTQILI